MKRTLYIFLLSVVFPFLAFAETDSKDLVKTSLLLEKHGQAIDGTQDCTIGVHFQIKKGWHIYWKNSGESGMPTRVKWQLPAVSSVSILQWPVPSRFIERGDIRTIGYKNEATLITEASVSIKDPSQKIKADVRWLVCKDICIPGAANLEKTFEQISKDEQTLLAKAKTSLPESLPDLATEGFLFESTKDKQLILSLKGLSPQIEEIENHLQFFPEPNEEVIFGRPLATSFTSDASNTKGILIRVPLTIEKGLEPASLSGVLAISKDLSTSKKAEAIPIKVSSKTAVPKELSDPLSEQGKELKYKQYMYEEGEEDVEVFQLQTEQNIPLYLAVIYGFLGGIILNLMPCVLPIISIKVMSFLGGADKSRKDAITAAAYFSAGIIFSFLVLAGIVTALRTLGVELGWGFQFQYPAFVFGLAVVLFLLALGFFDLYSLSLPFMLEANKKTATLKSSNARDFFDGILATALSTPCSAPFLGVALVVAFSQSVLATFLIFISIGIGLALPYAYLATHPKLLKKLPKPGPWMYRLRQFMGFLLLGTIVWLLFVLDNLREDAASWTELVLLSIFFLFWLFDWKKESQKNLFSKVLFVFGILLAGGIIYSSSANIFGRSQHSGQTTWYNYSPELVSSMLEEQRAVFIDFTADWCVTCKANELYTISSKEVSGAIKEYNIAAVKADWTGADPVVSKALRGYGAQGVPLYVVISPSAPDNPTILSTLPSAKSLIDAFRKATIVKQK